ncbi:MAG: hypothetical protein E7376_01350 [Clostridiales bacterium]|nr:hypothetical protein [Clostridiales bacterium]
MPFCQFSSESVISNATSVDNIFINEFLPYANDTCVKVYLYGLYKCNTPNTYDNSLSAFANILGMTEDDVYSAFLYWQDQGLVQILATEPFEVVYNPIKNAITNTKKYNKEKYADFNMQLEAALKGRNISLNEYYQYYEFMEVHHMEPAALILIIEYCTRAKGVKVGYNYILTIARNWAYDGITSYEKVDEKLRELEQNSSEIGEIFATLGIKRVATIDEKEFLNKWKKEFEFSFNTILGVCKNCKKKKLKINNFEKLDSLLGRYYEMKLSSLKEIENYEKEKEGLYKISRKVCKELGLYYDNIEPVSSNYTQKWVLMGFGEEVLYSIANYCFKTSVRNLDGMDNVINKFYKLGIITADALNQYFENILLADNQIKEILDALGIVRNVNKFDRDFYKTWTEEWQMPSALINEATFLSKDKFNPMQHLNKLLSLWHNNNVKTIEESKKYVLDNASYQPKQKVTNNQKNREYSKNELGALFDNLEEVEL